MKYLKLFENHVDKDKLIYKIRIFVLEINDDWDYFKDCPFTDELLLHHQKEYIKEVYNNSKIEWDVSLDDFRKVYNEMVEEATKKIISELENKPDLYSKYGEYIENLGIKVPSWIVNMNKYNL